jgi:hypothetical protein
VVHFWRATLGQIWRALKLSVRPISLISPARDYLPLMGLNNFHHQRSRAMIVQAERQGVRDVRGGSWAAGQA